MLSLREANAAELNAYLGHASQLLSLAFELTDVAVYAKYLALQYVSINLNIEAVEAIISLSSLHMNLLLLVVFLIEILLFLFAAHIFLCEIVLLYHVLTRYLGHKGALLSTKLSVTLNAPSYSYPSLLLLHD